MMFEEDVIQEEQFARDTLERYAGCAPESFCSSLLLTNFPRYVEHFAKKHKVDLIEGSMFKVAHCRKQDVSILDFKIGSPAAALVIDLCAFLPVKTALMLGMCGGLRRRYKIGEYLVPVASIRAEGTSDFYFPPEVPALGNFLMQKAVSEVLQEKGHNYHIGLTFTTNKRFWEYNEDFKDRLKATRAQAIELECATLFTASYKRKFTLGALLLISDLPLAQVKTKKTSEFVYENFMPDHVQLGVEILRHAREMQKRNIKGSYHKEDLGDGLD
ncbi:MAG: AMP nucleosidase [Chlamydiales bacterium]